MPATSEESPRERLLATRRGVTVLIVLLLLSITLGLSYAIVRSQTTALQIQQNAGVQVSARGAALTGLTVALKEMHTSEWCYGDGVNTTLSGPIGDHESYRVTYAAGDPSLAADDPDSRYRVTLLSTGTATDPSDPERTSTHRARAVVRLVPRSVADEPSDWATMQNYTVYQSKVEPFEVDIPCRLEGPVRVQGKLKFAKHYPDDDEAWKRYLRDLNAMRLDGHPDYRPFNGPVTLYYWWQEPKYLEALRDYLAVARIYTDVDEAASDWRLPGPFTEYQIYPGGPVYTIPWLGSTLADSLEPDPSTNPLGLFYRDGDVTIQDNVTIQGSLFCRHDVSIEGANVHFEPVELPALHASEGSLRMPALTCNQFVAKPTASGGLTGLAAVFDEFLIEKSPSTQEFAFTGRLIAKKLFVKQRHPWEDVKWSDRYKDFKAQLEELGAAAVQYFPVWMAQREYDPKPLVTFKPDPSPVSYHWKKPYDPIYVPHPDDHPPGHPDDKFLRWDLVEWTDRL
ncbi:MAG TPA: hypothetical protein VMY37_37420 [Thermoguttaceae bacterium]|nr:hypothetical protein [Thermoguttaceae bacterium]